MTDATGRPDPDLASLVQMADAFGLEQDLVLTLPGQTLCGTLIGGRAWFAGLANVVQGQDPEETLRGGLATRFRNRSTEYESWGAGSALGDLDPDGPGGEDLQAMPDVDYIHLRDVTLAGSGSAQLLPRWRGLLSGVVGWTVGGFEDAPAD